MTVGELPAPARVRAGACALLGWRVMPLVPHTRKPALKDWPKEATSDLVRVASWWCGRYANHDVGVTTGPESGIWVLDIDVKWCNGFATLRDLFHAHGITRAPKTFRVWSPSRGQQWYWRYPADGRTIGNVASQPGRPGPLGDGLDVRGRHGMVVAPDGVGREIICSEEPIDAPDWLLDLVVKKPPRPRDPEVVVTQDHARRLAEDVAARLAAMPPDSGRNAALNGSAFQLGTLGALGVLGRDEVYDLMLRAGERNGMVADDGQRAFDATFKSGWEAGVAKGGAS